MGAASLLASLLLVPLHQARGETLRLFAPDGSVHFITVPGDASAGAGWLNLSEPQFSDYAAEIRTASSRYGVPERLVEAIIRVESAFNPWAVSRKGARGLMQLMPATASILGVRDAFDPQQNIEGGVRHLRGLIDRYPHDLRLALAAYNAGEQAVNWYRGVPPFPETRQYVKSVLTEYDRAEPSGPLPEGFYRHVAPNGTVGYTNVPPVSRWPAPARQTRPRRSLPERKLVAQTAW